MSKQFMVYVEWDPESKMFIGTIPSLPAAHSYAASVDELLHNMREVIGVVLTEQSDLLTSTSQFAGLYAVSMTQ